MIIHIVAFRWKPGIPACQVEAVKSQLLEFVSSLPEVRSYRCGPDVGASEMDNFDFAIVAEFDSIDDWRVYDKHPRHNEIRSGDVRPWIAERAAVQFEN
jgi:stress responsive alpha/beta barrel protein